MPLLFAGTLFLSALLLFCVQPLIAKMILPLLGGSPGVWNTCMVFFQAALLAGYLYAHAVTTWLSARQQVLVHLAVLLLPLLVLPLGVADAKGNPVVPLGPDADPILWELHLLAVVVGLPFFVVATSAPLLQKWFASSGHAAASDPYFLYAASNLGSMAALLGYPFLLEPFLRLAEQSWLWTVGYGLLVPLIGACGFVIWRTLPVSFTTAHSSKAADAQEGEALAAPQSSPMGERGCVSAPSPPSSSPPETTISAADEVVATNKPRWQKAQKMQPAAAANPELPTASPRDVLTVGRRSRWVALALMPSALMLAVTSYITTDVAAMPLLWVAPLAVYLLSFILVFARRQVIPHAWMLAVLPIATLVVIFTFLTNVALFSWFLIPLHWLVLFLAAMTCHGELARDRPPPRYLTEFYLWLSVGGVLGGLFTTLLAPLLFQGGILEYPLILVLTCMLLPGPSLWTSSSVQRWLDLLMPLVVMALMLALTANLHRYPEPPTTKDSAIVLAVGVFVCVLLVERPIRFALSVLALFLAFSAANPGTARTLHVERNFFGVVRVQDNRDGTLRHLSHGSTLHGLQRLKDGRPDPNPEPLSYFTRAGPIGQVFEVFQARQQALPPRVAVTGLGVGALASYAQPGQVWTFYEIDPAIVRLAQPEAGLFTYLAASPVQGDNLKIVQGDARLRLREAMDHGYGLMILDAFSSDSVPMHLISREALALYRSKLAAGGILVFNISNRYLDLKPVLANLAAASEPPWVCMARDDVEVSREELSRGKMGSQWLVMAQRVEDLGTLAQDKRWQRLQGQPGARVWTDDFSNVLEVVKWR